MLYSLVNKGCLQRSQHQGKYGKNGQKALEVCVKEQRYHCAKRPNQFIYKHLCNFLAQAICFDTPVCHPLEWKHDRSYQQAPQHEAVA